jgi:hypothetical protein
VTAAVARRETPPPRGPLRLRPRERSAPRPRGGRSRGGPGNSEGRGEGPERGETKPAGDDERRPGDQDGDRPGRRGEGEPNAQRREADVVVTRANRGESALEGGQAAHGRRSCPVGEDGRFGGARGPVGLTRATPGGARPSGARSGSPPRHPVALPSHRSGADRLSKRREPLLADAVDLAQLLDRLEPAVPVAIGDDGHGELGTDPVERVELLGRRRRERDGPVRSPGGGPGTAAPTAPAVAPPGDAATTAPAAASPRRGTMTCCASRTVAARLNAVSSARDESPPSAPRRRRASRTEGDTCRAAGRPRPRVRREGLAPLPRRRAWHAARCRPLRRATPHPGAWGWPPRCAAGMPRRQRGAPPRPRTRLSVPCPSLPSPPGS